MITFGLEGDNGTETAYKYRSPTYNFPPYYGYYNYDLGNITFGGQVDFRVQAIIGYSTRINTTFSGPPIGLEPGESYHYYIFTGQSSNWSNIQTITIPEGTVSTSASPNSTTSTQNPTSTPTVPEFSPWTIPLLLTVMVALAGLLFYHKKRKLGITKP